MRVLDMRKFRRDLFRRRDSAKATAPSFPNSTPNISSKTKPILTFKAFARRVMPESPSLLKPKLSILILGLTPRDWKNFFMSLPTNLHLFKESTLSYLEDDKIVPNASAPL